MNHTFVSEKEAAEKLGYAPYTVRQKATATGPYKDKEPLPITFTKGGKGYRYSLQDIEKHLRKSSSK